MNESEESHSLDVAYLAKQAYRIAAAIRDPADGMQEDKKTGLQMTSLTDAVVLMALTIREVAEAIDRLAQSKERSGTS